MAEVTIRGLLMLPQLSDAQVSPDGSALAYVRRETDWAEDRYERRIEVLERVPGAEDTFELAAACKGRCPRWSPDGGRLAFLGRSREGETVIGIWSAVETALLCQVPPGSHGLRWSPTGEGLSLLAPVLSQKREGKPAWTAVGEEGEAPIELWIAEVATGDVRAWSRLGGHIADYEWHPDGRRVVCCVNRSTQSRHWDTGSLHVLDVGEDVSRPILEGRCRRAVWRLGGDALAVERLGTPSFLANPRIEEVTPAGKVIRTLPMPDDVHLLRWTPHGLLGLVIAGCSSVLSWIDPDTGGVEPVVEAPPLGLSILEGWWGEGCSVTADGERLGAVTFDIEHVGEVALVGLEDGSVRYVSSAASDLREWGVPAPEVVRWRTDDGAEIEGVLVSPADRDADGPRPLIVVLHGGPTAMASLAPMADNDWIWGAIPELSRRGAYVLLPNYRGSVGYGEAFRAANAGRLGLVNALDITAGIDQLAKEKRVDPSRVAALGASHGGYLAAFLAAFTDRLAAAVTRSGISDWRLNALLNQDPNWEDQYFSGGPEEAEEAYREASVLPYVDANTSPTLIIHGDRDRQAPTENARALHRVLTRHGVPCRFLLYHGMGHGGATPSQTEHSLDETLDWLERWIGLTPRAATL
jgi:dipeptidyl aminopeptidase/acylaminoacyl peptidase